MMLVLLQFLPASYPFLGYVGPGAGFAFLGSFVILFSALVLALLSLLFLPVRVVLSLVLKRRRSGEQQAGRLVVLGLDGLDPKRFELLRERGKLPNLQALSEEGSFSRLQSTCPPMSPVAWSSFSTGVNPGKHGIFDFLARDPSAYVPVLSSTRIDSSKGGRLFRRSKPDISLLRRSKPFWKVLGEHGVFSTILRVPITFPPEKFSGLCLAGMCVPDLRGTQGSYTLFESSATDQGDGGTGEDCYGSEGSRVKVKDHNNIIETKLEGPRVDGMALAAPMVIRLNATGESAELKISGSKVKLLTREYSDWVKVTFKKRFLKATGICRFLLISGRPDFKLYVTPVNIDPEKPVMPLSHPAYYSTYLGKLHGSFATLGLAEDTSALSDGVIDEDAFLKQAYDIHEERKHVFLDALKRTRKGVCCCVFDLSDRIQHMFYGYSEDPHLPDGGGKPHERFGNVVSDAYCELDRLVGRVRRMLGRDDVLIVMSDHGFAAYRRNVNLNKWLEQEGYLKKKDGSGSYLTGIDWSETSAYCFGLSGIYLNIRGRDPSGVVDSGERAALKREITDKLMAMKDPETGGGIIHAVYDSENYYDGPYVKRAPDLIVGYKQGYRISWESAKGNVEGEIITNNEKPWNGDHCIDTSLVPGVLFCNRTLALNGHEPHITDIAPTILKVFGIDKPRYMDGVALDMDNTQEAHG